MSDEKRECPPSIRDTRFKKGVSGNPAGKRKTALIDGVHPNDIFRYDIGPKAVEVVRSVVERAALKNGNVSKVEADMVKYAIDRVFGKAIDRVHVSNSSAQSYDLSNASTDFLRQLASIKPVETITATVVESAPELEPVKGPDDE